MNFISKTKQISYILALPFLIHLSSFAYEINKKNLFIPHHLGKVAIFKNLKGFTIKDKEGIHPVNPDRIDTTLKKMSPAQLTKFLRADAGYISVQKSKEGSYTLSAHHRIRAGGAGGAVLGAFLGKGITSAIGHGTLALIASGVSLLATPAAGAATFYFLEGTVGPFIESTSFNVAIATGIVLGAATGPI